MQGRRLRGGKRWDAGSEKQGTMESARSTKEEPEKRLPERNQRGTEDEPKKPGKAFTTGVEPESQATTRSREKRQEHDPQIAQIGAPPGRLGEQTTAEERHPEGWLMCHRLTSVHAGVWTRD